jgi:hypothetical protein
MFRFVTTTETSAMWLQPQTQVAPEELQSVIRQVDAVTPQLLSAVVDLALARWETPNRAAYARRIGEFVASRAWTDAALALVALDRSHTIRRVVYDDGDWHCTIGSQWPVPEWLDDTVEFGHPVLPLAILGAFLGALCQLRPAALAATSVPQVRSDASDTFAPVSCDNFA